MSARTVWRPVAALASVAAWSACDFIRPPDPLEAHPDVVTISILLIAGESEARLVAVHPHRPRSGEAPEIAATLEGPGWSAPFLEELELHSCTSSTSWPGPLRCLGATLPEPLRANERYAIVGKAPLGAFRGATTTPAAPEVLDPGDSLRLQPVAPYTDLEIPMRFQTGSDIGTVLVDVWEAFETLDDGEEVEINRHHLGYFPRPVEGAEADTVFIYYHTNPLRFKLHLLGIGRHYTNFLASAGTFPIPRPWPSFGIEGEGVYGYFDGLTPSRPVRVRVR